MATPRQHVVHADRKDGAIDQNAKPYATVTESADKRWNRKKENVKSKWIFISFIPISRCILFIVKPTQGQRVCCTTELKCISYRLTRQLILNSL